jgi:hypothetical protein
MVRPPAPFRVAPALALLFTLASSPGCSDRPSTTEVSLTTHPSRVVIFPTNLVFEEAGDHFDFTVRVQDRHGHAVGRIRVHWESSDEAVATVSASGRVTAVAEGEATVTASVGDGTLKATAEVLVGAG